jgi:hypothetical protein
VAALDVYHGFLLGDLLAQSLIFLPSKLSSRPCLDLRRAKSNHEEYQVDYLSHPAGGVYLDSLMFVVSKADYDL